jgi:N-formylglutamate deformylase
MKNAVLIHLPHSSLHIPAEVRKDILLGDTELENELLAITDRYTEELYAFEAAVTVENEYSRLVFDPERFRNDAEEGMARFGMGVVYTATVDGRRMRILTSEEREDMVRQYYDPYHQRLEAAASRILDEQGKCLLIDGHSFPALPLPFELDQNPDRPDICIGTCDFHTPEWLTHSMEENIRSHGLSVCRNFPFAGTMVPMKYYRKDSRISSVMIEINRRLYMDEKTGGKLPGFQKTRELIQGLLQEMVQGFHKAP